MKHDDHGISQSTMAEDIDTHQHDEASKPDMQETLRHRLMGPSLTKAGQDTVDQSKVYTPSSQHYNITNINQKVSEIIYNASKGSKFFNNEQVKDRQLTEKITRILARKEQLSTIDTSNDLRKADEYIAQLELSRDLSQTIIHVDCDAYYAAVEELDRPELKDVPFAVGKGVLTTCNYHARKFGCRSGMAGFVAMKLCPQLICLPLNFAKYSAKAEEVRAVLAEYDPRYESASVDEAYLNITSYCQEHEMEPDEVVQQMRAEVFEKCKITISAGIASNAKLAKIGSNKNKPNGQFRLPADRASIMAFMRDLPCRKVNGVGRVFERELEAIGIQTCGDIYPHRALLTKLFGEKAFQFLIQCYLGLGRTTISPAGEYERKSVGTERTFHEIQGKAEFRDKMRQIADELEDDLKRTENKGRTLVLKVKLHTYEVLTRQAVTPYAVHKADDLYKFGLQMLTKLEKELPNMRLRLMGLRCTNLVSTVKGDLDFFGLQRKTSTDKPAPNTDADGWEIWPEEEFEDAAKREREEDMAEMERFSQEHQQDDHDDKTPTQQTPTPKEQFWDCPICQRPQAADERALNEHIDACLSRQTIKEVVQEATPDVENSANLQKKQNKGLTLNGRKRGRPRESEKEMQKSAKRKAFFS
jgi:DNA polymerase kappa